MFGLIVIANENPSTKIILFELENSIEKDIELESLNEHEPLSKLDILIKNIY